LKFINSKIKEIAVVILLFAIIIVLRVNHLEADPPNDLSISTDVFTDPAQYTLFAKQLILTGDINPFNENRFMFFIISSVTGVSILLFQLLGVSIFSSNLTGLIYSFGSLFFFYLIVKKSADRTAALFFLLMISVNYNQIFYGRLPFLEHAMTFYAFLSLVLLLYFPNNKGYLLSGVFLAIGIFFGKIIGIVFIAVVAIYLAHKSIIRKQKANFRHIGLFTGGLIGVFLIWFFTVYLPMQEQVTSYVEEQAFSLYGFPLALQSFDNFIWKFVSFGDDSKLFSRMAIPSILGTFFIGSIFIKSRYPDFKKRIESSHLLIISIIISYYLFLMIWNYRPLRYQLVLIYPFYGAAGIVLSRLWNYSEAQLNFKIRTWKIVFLFPLVYPIIYQLFDAYISLNNGIFYYSEYRWTVIIMSMLVTGILFGVLILINNGYINPTPTFKKITVLILIGSILIPGAFDYYDWTKRVSYKIRDNNIDLGVILSEKAIVSGPYAATLTQANNKSSIIHMFGVSESDPDFFKKNPITHLLLDHSNEKRAEADYPVIMDSADLIMTYYVGLTPVRLFRIAGFTENDSAGEYELSDFEIMVDSFKNGIPVINKELTNRFIEHNPVNISAYSLLAEEAERDSLYDIAEKMFKKAVEFSSINYNLNAKL